MSSKQFVFYKGLSGEYTHDRLELDDFPQRDVSLQFHYSKKSFRGYISLRLFSIRYECECPEDTVTYTNTQGMACRVRFMEQDIEHYRPPRIRLLIFGIGDFNQVFEYGTHNADTHTEIYDDESILGKYLVLFGIEKEVYLSPCRCYALLRDLDSMLLFFAVEDGKVVRYEYVYTNTHYTNKYCSWIKSKGGKLLHIEKPYFDVKSGLARLYIKTAKDESASYTFLKQEDW